MQKERITKLFPLHPLPLLLSASTTRTTSGTCNSLRKTVQSLSQPKAAVGLTDDYVLTGGGAIVNYTGAGNMLNASFPSPNPNGDGDWYIWNAHSKDHDISDPASITVYAIGIRLRGAPVNSPGVRSFIIAQTTPPTDKPQIKTDTMGTTPGDACLSGGGAWDEWSGAGNMLTASGPTRDNDWFARGSDHITASPALPLGDISGSR
jgi:vibriolysin